MPHELYRKSGSGRYDEDKSYKRPKKGEKGPKPKPSTGDYSAKKKKPATKKEKRVTTVREAKEAIGKYKQKQKERLDKY